jgi:type I restriction enzyme S subunit
MRNGWTKTTFGDVFKIVAGKYVPKEEYVEGGEFWIYGSNSIMGKIDRFLVEQSHVVMAAIGAYAGAVRYSHEPSWINNNAMALVPSDKVMAKYLHLWLESEFDLKRVVVGTGQPYVQRPLLLKEIIDLPPLPEQKRIVDLISSVDSYIEALQQQLQSAQNSRNAVLHEMLSAGGEGWIETVLGEIVSIINGGTPSTKKPEYWDGGIPWITTTELTHFDGKVIGDSQRTLTQLGLQEGPSKLVEKGTILLGTTATIGTIGFVQEPLAFNQQITGLKIKSNHNDPWFVFYYLQSIKYKLENLSAGTSFKRIATSILKTVPMVIPPSTEQKRIVDLISSMDEGISATEKLISETKQLRSGILSDLLSGDHEIPVSYDKVMGAA